MKRACVASRGEEGDRTLHNKRLLQSTFGLTLALLLLTGCGGGSAGQEGELIGIGAEIAMEEAQSGEIENIAYTGTVLAILPDGEEVTANCPENLVSDIKGAPAFNVDEISEGLVAAITVNLEEGQKVLLDQNEVGEWEVTEVLE